ncbi:hypothetical protein ACIGD1_17170 [Streptomyces sp. NPDC085612]|uniref:hypothetical protein n=1 Tax=Streptomyces sp. NPDC085612 TaxID=3365732 RepID=UPI0037D1A781
MSAFPLSRDGAGGPAVPCVSTPAEYRAAWEAREVRCLAPPLFGTTHARGETSLYPTGFRYAWAGSSTNLEQYLRGLRARYGDQPEKVGVGVLSYVGYPGLDDWSTPTDLEVYTLPAGVRAQVPAFETWFRLLDEEFGTTGAYPLAAQRDLAAAGPSPYDGADSSACCANFRTRYRGERDAPALRGALFQCQDAGFLNTGVGLGHNTYANPFVCRPADRQSVRERYTGREFILPNAHFAALPSHIAIPLDLGTPGQRDFLHTGYCR